MGRKSKRLTTDGRPLLRRGNCDPSVVPESGDACSITESGTLVVILWLLALAAVAEVFEGSFVVALVDAAGGVAVLVRCGESALANFVRDGKFFSAGRFFGALYKCQAQEKLVSDRKCTRQMMDS